MHAGDLRSAGAGELPRSRVPADALTRTLAIIIPALNEAQHLGALLDDIAAQDLDVDVVVVDGGSHDDTVHVAEMRGVRVIDAPRGRASQMNAGRATVDADWLLFLHADTRIEDRGLLRRAISAPTDDECGHFQLRFRADDWRFRYLEAKTALNRPHTTNGDQGMLVPATLFDALGGFDCSLGFLEDQRFAEAARDAGRRWITLPGELSTSARRFRRDGFSVRYFGMAVLMSAWGGGAHELFERHPNAYEYDLSRLIGAVRETTARMDMRRTVSAYLATARFMRGEAWQLFFMADAAIADELPDGATPLLDWYDTHLGEMDLPIVDAAVAAAVYLLMNAVLSPG